MSAPASRPGATAALAACLFVYLTCELLPIGAQPEIAADLGVSSSQVGLLVTWYAVAAGLATLPLVRAGARWDARTVLVGSMVVLAVCQVGFATATSLTAPSVWRVGAALLHGVVWSQVPVVAARLGGPGAEGRATSRVLIGASLGLLLGSPLAAAATAFLGWRPASALLGVTALVSAVALRLALPSLDPDRRQSAGAVQEPVAWGPVLVVCAITAVVVTGHYVSYTFVVPLAERAGLPGGATPLVLAGYGAAGLIGVLLVGKPLDHRPSTTTTATLLVLAGGLALVLAPGVGAFVVAVLLWGAAAGALPPVLNTAALRADPVRPDIASGAYVVAYQIGISGGAALGAAVLAGGSASRLPVVACALVGLGVLGTAVRHTNRRP